MTSIRFVALFAIPVMCSCAGAADEAERNPPGAEFASSAAALTPLDPPPTPGFWSLTELESLDVWGCRFTVIRGQAALPPARVSAFFIRKSQVPGRSCANTGYRLVQSGLGLFDFDFVRHPFLPALVFSVVVPPYPPYGPPYGYVRIQQLDFADLTTLRSSDLRTVPRPLEQPQGSVLSARLQLDLLGNLVVTGAMNDVIPGMIGEGTRYRAVYRHFLCSPTNLPQPDSIVAF